MMTSSTSNPVAPESSAPRRRNNHHIADAYLDLMKPDESLTDQHDATERRKIQNRLAQRAYRRNLRDRNMEVKMLREELQRMREAASQEPSTPLSQAQSPHDTTSGVQGSKHDQQSIASSTVPGPTSPQSHPGVFAATLPDLDFMTTCNFDTYPDNWALDSSSEPLFSLPDGSIAAATAAAATATAAPLPTPPMPPMSYSLSTRSLTSAAAVPPYTAPSNPKPQQVFPPGYGRDGEYLPPPIESSGCSPVVSAPNNTPNKHPPARSSHLPNAREPLVYHALASGNLETLRYLLAECHVSSNVRDSAGYTPLQRAVMAGRTDMVALLLNAGANIEDFDDLSEEIDGE